jgi:hypothetical protein
MHLSITLYEESSQYLEEEEEEEEWNFATKEMISIFIRNISLHASMQYSRGSVSCENILARGLLLKVIELRVSTTDRVTSSLRRKFYGCHHDLAYCYENVCFTDDLDTFRFLNISNTCVTRWSDNCLPFRNTGIHPCFVTRWSDNRLAFENTGVHPCFYWGLCCSIFTFLCSVLWSIVCHFGHCIIFPSEIYKFC